MKTTMTTRAVLCAAALGAALSVGTAEAQDTAPADATGFRHFFGTVGLAAGQTARLTVVNTLPPGPVGEELPPGPIRVRLVLFGKDIEALRAE